MARELVPAEQDPRQDTDVESDLEENQVRKDADIESGSLDENQNTQIRHAIVRKVYWILLVQVAFTAGMMLLITMVEALVLFVVHNMWFVVVPYFVGLILIIMMSPKLHWYQKHWVGYLLCAASTVLFSVSVGAIGANATKIWPFNVLVAGSITGGLLLLLTILAFEDWTEIPKGEVYQLGKAAFLFVASGIWLAHLFISDSETKAMFKLASFFLWVIVFSGFLFSATKLLSKGHFTTSLISPKEAIYWVIFIMTHPSFLL